MRWHCESQPAELSPRDLKAPAIAPATLSRQLRRLPSLLSLRARTENPCALKVTLEAPFASPSSHRGRSACGSRQTWMRLRSGIGVEGGMATVAIPLRGAEKCGRRPPGGRSFARAARRLARTSSDRSTGRIECSPRGLELPVGNGNLVARVGIEQQRVTTLDRLMLLLPVLMWVTAALVTWLLVSRLLLRPLKRLESAVTQYHPGQAAARASAPARTFDRNPGAT